MTEIVGDYSDIEQQLAGQLFKSNYEDLMKLARYKRRRGKETSTLDTFEILHESFLKLAGKTGWVSRKHFINAAALAMRQVILDHARRKQSAKRGRNAIGNSLDENDATLPEYWESTEQLIEISHLMDKLERENIRWMRVVDARYFSGFTEEEAALILGVSARTIRRDWQAARAWMADMMGLKS